MNFEDRHIGILGTGEAGMSAARWLGGSGARVVCLDDRELGEWDSDFLSWCRDRDVTTIGCCGNGSLPDGIELLVVSPGVPPSHRIVSEATDRGVPVVGELYLAACLWQGPLVGITGTNGKTTTTLLTAHILDRSGVRTVAAGNISPPLFELFDKNHPDTCAVLEISSFQLEYFPAAGHSVFPGLASPVFKAAVCLNVAPDHIDRHGSLEAYGRAKERLFSFVGPESVAVLGPGAEGFETAAPKVLLARAALEETGGRPFLVVPFRGSQARIDLSSWKMAGRHNLENLAAAAVCALALGVGEEEIGRAVSDFTPPGHRMEEVGRYGGIAFVDDSKATNLHAVASALAALSGPVVLIAGGRAKGEDFSELARLVSASENGAGTRITGVVLVGEAAHRMQECLGNVTAQVRMIEGRDGHDVMERAVREAMALAGPGHTVLLSPGCASFDMFSSYKHRGEAFAMAVRKVCQQS